MAGSRIFNGSNAISLGTNSGSAVNSLAGFTICAWMYRAASGTNAISYSAGASSSNAVVLWWYGLDNKIYFDTRTSGSQYCCTGADTSTGWVHWAGVFLGGVSWAIYKNGVSQSITNNGSPPASTSTSLSTVTAYLGHVNWSGNIWTASGNALGWCSIHNVALGENEIQSIMRTPNVGRGMIGCWSNTANESSTSSKWESTWAGSYGGTPYNATVGTSLLTPNISFGKSH